MSILAFASPLIRLQKRLHRSATLLRLLNYVEPYRGVDSIRRTEGDTGDFASVKYTTVASGDTREVEIHSQDGLEHFFFNDAGYTVREDFSRGKETAWSLRRVRDAQTNAVLDVRLQCRTVEIRVPTKLDGLLEKSQLHIPYFSRYCQQIDSKLKSKAEDVSSSLEAGRIGTK